MKPYETWGLTGAQARAIWEDPNCGQDIFKLFIPKPMTPDYTNAIADLLTVATLAKPEVKKAAMLAILKFYFPSSGETPAVFRNMKSSEIGLIVLPDGQVERWEGMTYRGTYATYEAAMNP